MKLLDISCKRGIVVLTFFAMPQVDPKEMRELDRAVGMSRLHDYLPAAWIDNAIRSTDKASLRRRRLPAEKVVFLVIALALYRQHSASEVVDELDIALPKMDGAFVSKSAITQARQRVGAAPVEWLFKESAKNWITESGDQAKFKGFSLFAIDGTTLRTPDSQCNRDHFGSQLSRSGRIGSYPKVRGVTLSSIQTHLICDAEFGPYGINEMLTARRLVPRIPNYSITVFDKGFMSAQILCGLRASGERRHFIIPAKSNTRWTKISGTDDDQIVSLTVSLPARRANPNLPDSWRARAIRTTDAKGRRRILLTSLTDSRRFKPSEIEAVYRRRWQVETSYMELKNTMLGTALTLRSETVECVYQEIWGALIAYNLIRIGMTRIARQSTLDPLRLSFIRSYHAMQLTFLGIANADMTDDAPMELIRLGKRIAQLPHRSRPGRICPRTVKARPFRYPSKKLRTKASADLRSRWVKPMA